MPTLEKIKSIRVVHDSPVDLYFQIRSGIQELIREGRLRPGDKLPTVREIAALHRVSLVTANRALRFKQTAVSIRRSPGEASPRLCPSYPEISQ